MLKFLRTFLAVFLALILSLVIGFVILLASLKSIGSKKQAEIKENSILLIDFSKEIPDRSSKDPFQQLDLGLGGNSGPGLNDMLEALNKAASDERIKAVYLRGDFCPNSIANLRELRGALQKFKESGKPVFTYSEMLSQKGLYLSSVSNEIWLNPYGWVDLRGISSEGVFLKGLLDKLDIKAHLIRVGKYKSAGESFSEQEFSPENRAQLEAVISSMYDEFISGISSSLSLPQDSLKAWASRSDMNNSKMALERKVVHKLWYQDQVIDSLRSLCGFEKKEELRYVSSEEYIGTQVEKGSYNKPRVAVLYAQGEIVDGKGDEDNIGGTRFAAELRKLREDDKVKAVVIRVNSPGGSALASDIIWREVGLTKKVKPVVVSMGGVAASGGYYISCDADHIFAEPSTITGSIGVFGIILEMQEFWKKKLGITFDRIKTGPFADLGNPNRPMTPEDRALIQTFVDRVYEEFTQKVAQGRDLPLEKVLEIAQGRIWSGTDALALGLVDTLGGLNDAVAYAAAKAELKDFRVWEYPVQKDPIEELVKDLMGQARASILGSYEPLSGPLRHLPDLNSLQGVQARMPVELVF